MTRAALTRKQRRAATEARNLVASANRLLSASKSAALIAEAHLRDHHTLMASVGELVRGGSMNLARSELERADLAFQRYRAALLRRLCRVKAAIAAAGVEP